MCATHTPRQVKEFHRIITLHLLFEYNKSADQPPIPQWKAASLVPSTARSPCQSSMPLIGSPWKQAAAASQLMRVWPQQQRTHCGPEVQREAAFWTGADGGHWEESGDGVGEAYFYTSPAIASRSEGFKWVNDMVFLSQGRVRITEKGKLEVGYRIFRVD